MPVTALSPNLMVDDMPRALAFYRDTLGFTVEASQPPEGDPVWAQLRSGAASVMLQTRASLGEELPILHDAPIGASQTLYISVEDTATFDALYTQVKAAQAIVRDLSTTFYGAREFVLRDSEGYLLVFACFASAPASGPEGEQPSAGDATAPQAQPQEKE